jgi:hypothetical protein
MSIGARVLWPLCHARASRFVGDPIVSVSVGLCLGSLFAGLPLHERESEQSIFSHTRLVHERSLASRPIVP